ncbi:MAG TPA: AAA family ATPase, partial [Solirubrobacteraceae bacterium]|nr:AAA family ATPase [Solirubrobacteraceae bacterium]
MLRASSIDVDVLVGRDEELRLIERVLGDGSGTGVVLMGTAGVGKTRLARAVAHGYGPSGGRWLWVAGTRSAQDIPFGIFAGLLGAVDAPGQDRLDAMMAVRRAVLASVGDSGLLVVDDAHLLDQASAVVVHSLAISRGPSLIITVRSGTPSPDAVTALWKDGLLECVELQPLAHDEVGQLLVALLRGEVDARAHERVWELTRGNPFFCCELVRAAAIAGVLSYRSGAWHWRGALPGVGRLWDLIEARLSDLDARELAALEAIALADGADTALLERVVEPAARLSLLRRALVEQAPVEDGSVVRLAHPLYGEAVRARLTTSRRRELSRLLADAAESAGLAHGPELLRVAGWRLEAGETGHPDLLIAAARRAQAAFDPALAERCAGAAVAAGGGAKAERALAVALGALGQVDASDEIFRRLARSAETDAERALLAAAQGEMLMLSGLRAADAAAVAGRAASQLGPGT